MVYANTDGQAAGAMFDAHYGDGGHGDAVLYGECTNCGEDIYVGDRYYEYGFKMYCKECFKEVLFDELADEYREEAGAA